MQTLRRPKSTQNQSHRCGVLCEYILRVNKYPLAQLKDHKTMRLPSTPLPAVRHSALSDRERDISTPRDAVAIACTALLLAIVESFCECFAETHASQATRLFEKSDAHGGRRVVPDNIITLQAAREGGVYVASSLRHPTMHRASDS